MTRRDERRASVERALIHHGVDYSPPGGGRSTWLVTTGLDRREMTTREVEQYVVGLADGERRYAMKQ